jgi:uncharacterized protein (TIGR00369 family)
MELDEVIASWEKEEQSVRARLMAPGVATQEQVRGMSGMEMFQAIFAGELPPPPIGETLDFVPIHMAPGIAVFQGRPQLRHYNPLGTVHGGWFATLLDSAVGCAVHTTLPAGRGYTTLELKVNMVRALTKEVPFVRRGQGDSCGEAGGDCGRADRRAGWQAVCACDDDLPDFRVGRPGSAWLS